MNDQELIRAMKALAEPRRLEILHEIQAREGEQGISCQAILEKLTITQPTLSHHVSELVSAGLLTMRPEGRCSFLKVNRETMNEVAQKLAADFADTENVKP